MVEELNMPEFLQDRYFESIMAEMVAAIPKDIDMSEGSHPYNLIAPTARQEEYFAQYIMAEAVKLIFPKFCEGYSEYVDYHAETNGLYRKESTHATGTLTATGTPFTVIPEGSVFSTVSINDIPSMEFVSTAEAVIDENGTAEIPIRASVAGAEGNVLENTIILQDNPIDGVESVINTAATSGGIEEETDASLIQRIIEYEEMQGLSFVGNDSDYKRWAEEVNGTGVATVVPPAKGDDSGLVTIILTDSMGKPATTELCKEVYDHIVSPNDAAKRLAPINGAVISVVPPVVVSIKVTAAVKLTDMATLSTVKSEFLKNIAAYMAVVPEDKQVVYTKVGAILSDTIGVADYDSSSLKVNGSTSNIMISLNEFPEVTSEDVTFAEMGSVV